MPVEWVAGSVAASRALQSAFEGCWALYIGFSKAERFPSDFIVTKHLLDAQYARFHEIGKTKINQLQIGLDVEDSSGRVRADVILGLVRNAEIISQDCEKLVQRVEKRRRERSRLHKPPPTSLGVAAMSPVSSTTPSHHSAVFSPSTRSIELTPGTSTSSLDRGGPSSEAMPIRNEAVGKRSLLSGLFGKKAQKGRKSMATGAPTAPRPAVEALSDTVSSMLETGRDSEGDEVREYMGPETILKQKGKLKLVKMVFTEELAQFEKQLERFTKTTDSLADLLEMKSSSTGSGLPTPQAIAATATFEQASKITQDALKRLHRSIRSMNSNERAFTIRMEYDFGSVASEFAARYDYFGLRKQGDFFYFKLQQHQPADSTDRPAIAYEFISETQRQAPKQSAVSPAPEVPAPDSRAMAIRLDQATSCRSRAHWNSSRYEKWGLVVNKHSKELGADHHMLFKDKMHWSVFGSLSTIMSSHAQQVKQMPIWQRAELATLAATAVLYLRGIRQESWPIGLGSFKYYTQNQNRVWDNRNPILLRPYLDVGFGQHLDHWHACDIRCPLHDIVGLGIMLYQILGCSALGFDPQENPKAALDWAQKQHRALVRTGLLEFVEVAQDCATFKSQAMAGQSEVAAAAENEAIANKVMRLKELERRYSECTDAGLSIPGA